MKKTLLTTLLGAGLLLAGCGQEPLTRGEIYEKVHEPERRGVMLLPITQVHSTGNNTYTTTMFIPMFYRDDEDFIIRIRGVDDSSGKSRTQDLYLTKEDWNRCEVGGCFNCAGKIVAFEDKLEKRKATEEDKQKYEVEEAKESS